MSTRTKILAFITFTVGIVALATTSSDLLLGLGIVTAVCSGIAAILSFGSDGDPHDPWWTDRPDGWNEDRRL